MQPLDLNGIKTRKPWIHRHREIKIKKQRECSGQDVKSKSGCPA